MKPAMHSAIAQAERHRITVRGHDLCRDLIGQVAFSEHFLLILTGVRPSPTLLKLVDACLVAIAEHGLVPSVQAARMTLAAAPDALQGAVAAGLLGCGPVILGATEAAGHLLIDIVAQATPAGNFSEAASHALKALRDAGKALPGFGHALHRDGDPRAAKLIDIARDLGVAGPHVAALLAAQVATAAVFGRELVLNVSGAMPAVLLDAGYPVGALRGIPLLARTASLIGH